MNVQYRAERVCELDRIYMRFVEHLRFTDDEEQKKRLSEALKNINTMIIDLLNGV